MRTICDNLKTSVVRHPKEEEIILTNDYIAVDEHYVTTIMSDRIRKTSRSYLLIITLTRSS